MLKKTTMLIALLGAWGLHAQTIRMDFPAFAGKTYDFIIFQGDEQVKAQQDTIPPDGKFELVIPKGYAPYTGMCRWLLTNSRTGGGLDMAIPGKGFSVACADSVPSETNIVYKGYDPVNELNRLFGEQQHIIEKYQTISKAAQLYGKGSKLYPVMEAEKKAQAKAYEAFQAKLKSNPNYAARFLPIVNLTRGIAPRLTNDYTLTAKYIAHYMADEMNMDDFYTSGHWSGLIAGWVQLQTNVINNDSVLASDFRKMGERLKLPKRYREFVEQVTYYLSKYGKDKQIERLAPVVTSSGKITDYSGVLSVYTAIKTGQQAPDLIIREYVGAQGGNNYINTKLESRHFASGDYKKTLLVFYESGCGPCEELMQQLPGNYEKLKAKGIRVIAIAADTNVDVFRNTSHNFPWQDTFCDYEGKSGVNFKNYGAVGTPMMFLIDKGGNVTAKMATAEELLARVAM